MISDEGQLTRLSTADGSEVWSTPLPYFLKEKEKKRRGIHAQLGPVLAGGRLWVAGSDGQLRAYDPAQGNLLGAVSLPGGAASLPIIVRDTLFVVSANGNLLAFR